MIIKKDYRSKNVFNLYKKHLVTVAFHYNCYAEFNWRRDHFEDEPRAARPTSIFTPQNIEAARQLIILHPHLTYQ